MAVAVGVRALYWIVAPPVRASDSALYLRTANALAEGHWRPLIEYPFHAAYAVMLSPAFWNPAYAAAYIACLHIALSAASVACLWAIGGRLSADPRAPLVSAALGTFYPGLLFWLPYVLTETAFIFVLLVFVWTLLVFIDRPTVSRAALVALIAVPMFFLRPVAIALVGAASLIVVSTIVKRLKAPWILALGAVAAMLAVVLFTRSVPHAGATVMRIPTVAQTLWLSTTVVHGTQAELTRATLPPPMRDWPEPDQFEYKARAALTFIADHPGLYLAMAGRRLVSFWAPWLYLDWSLKHRAVDAVVSVVLVVAACFAVRTAANTTGIALLLGFALLLSLESAFGQIDADARYRLPAEVLLIAPAAVSACAAARRIVPSARQGAAEICAG